MVGICPFHDDSRPSMKVNASKQIFKCFACGAGGNVIQFLMRRERMNFPEAVVFLADQAGENLTSHLAKLDKLHALNIQIQRGEFLEWGAEAAG